MKKSFVTRFVYDPCKDVKGHCTLTFGVHPPCSAELLKKAVVSRELQERQYAE